MFSFVGKVNDIYRVAPVKFEIIRQCIRTDAFNGYCL